MSDTVTISREDYNRLLNAKQDLDDSREIGRVMADIAAGGPTLTSAEADDYLAAVTPLAFWRKRTGKTHDALAAEIGVSPALLMEVESGQREVSVNMLVKLARALGVKVDDLLED